MEERIQFIGDALSDRFTMSELCARYGISFAAPYPSRLLPLEYPSHYLVKKVTTGGTFRFQHKPLYIANSLVDQHIWIGGNR